MRSPLLLLLAHSCVAPDETLIPDPFTDQNVGVEISPLAIDFGSQRLGLHQTRTVLLMNHGDEKTRVRWSLDPGPFSIASDELELEPGERREILVVFEARALGIYSDRIDFGIATVELEGAAYDGVDLDEPIRCQDASLFADVGECARAEVSCTNAALTDIAVTSSWLQGDAAFTIVGAPPASIPARGSVAWEIEFCPTAQGWFYTCFDLRILAVDEREYVAHSRISAETPHDEPVPPVSGIDCGSNAEPWVIGPTEVGEATFYGVQCRTEEYRGLDIIQIYPPVEGVSISSVIGQHLVIRFEPVASGTIETTLELTSGTALRRIPLRFIGE